MTDTAQPLYTKLIENRSLGIFWMLATMLCFIVLDSVMKYALETYSLVQVTWGRFFFATIVAAAVCGPRLPELSRTRSPWLQLLRSALLMITTGLFNAGIMYVPLVTATTIMFLSPIVVTVLSVVILGEHVGWKSWIGVVLGFIGAIVVVEPWHAAEAQFNHGALFFLAAAATNATYQIVTRKVRGDHPLTSLLFTAAAGAVVSSLLLAPHWSWPDLFGWALLMGAGIAGAVGHLCLIKAFRLAPASVVAPFSYSSLVWATMLGFVIWGDLPALNVWIGAALIVTAGLYIFFLARKARPDQAGTIASAAD